MPFNSIVDHHKLKMLKFKFDPSVTFNSIVDHHLQYFAYTVGVGEYSFNSIVDHPVFIVYAYNAFLLYLSIL